MKFVICKANEYVDWLGSGELQRDGFIIQKGEYMPNEGREPAAFWLYIINNYEKLQGDYVFCQARPFDHDDMFLTNVQEKNYFGKVVTEASIPETDEFLARLGYPPQESYWFKGGCQFKLSAKEIRAISFKQYALMFAMAVENDRNPYIFERIMPILFPQLCKN